MNLAADGHPTKLIANAPDLVSHLRSLLVKRCQTNAAYSLRAFAKQLGIEPSFLSKILAGKRKVTVSLIDRLATPLTLSPAQVLNFKKQTVAPQELISATPSAVYSNLTIDSFQVIADWYHYAILELTKVEGFKLNALWISKKIGISVHEAKDAIDRLLRLELIEIDSKRKTILPVKNYTTTANDFTASAFRKLQKQVLLQALHALENTAYEERYQSSVTIAIHAPTLKQAKAKIAAFQKEMGATLQPAGKKYQEVYQLSISLFPAKKVSERNDP
jgi:uncharacterized protein (TIGR02147 family)